MTPSFRNQTLTVNLKFWLIYPEGQHSLPRVHSPVLVSILSAPKGRWSCISEGLMPDPEICLRILQEPWVEVLWCDSAREAKRIWFWKFSLPTHSWASAYRIKCERIVLRKFLHWWEGKIERETVWVTVRQQNREGEPQKKRGLDRSAIDSGLRIELSW